MNSLLSALAATLLGRANLAVVMLTLSVGAAAQDYRPVSGGDVSAHYVAPGTAVEVRGWVWTNESGTYYNVDLPSARREMRVDTADLPADQHLILTAKCFAAHQFAGGCRAIVRGVVAKLDNQPGLLARAIKLEPK